MLSLTIICYNNFTLNIFQNNVEAAWDHPGGEVGIFIDLNLSDKNAQQDYVSSLIENNLSWNYYKNNYSGHNFDEIYGTQITNSYFMSLDYGDDKNCNFCHDFAMGDTIYLPINAIKQYYETNTYKLKGFICVTNSSLNYVDSFVVEENLFSFYSVGFTCGVIEFQAQWEEVQSYNINYYDEGGSDFSGTHESNYAMTHTNGVTTTLDVPTKSGYTFDGWYDNQNCTGEPITELSAGTIYSGDINLYAKWKLAEISLTLNCTNYSNQNYFVYIYEGNVLKSQMFVQGQATIKLAYSEQKYKIQFVLSYLGTVSYSVNGGGLQNNKTLVLSDFKDTTISYQVFTSNINNNVII